MTPRKKRTTPTKTYERRIRTQRQREEELENTNLKKSIEEEGEHEIDISSTNVERDDTAVEEEQNDIAIPEKETSPIVELSPLSPSPDNFIVKSIRYANYNLESMIDRYPNLRGSLTVKSELHRKAFSAYPWGCISYDITIKHLLKAVKTIDGKTTNLYGFPWAFMIVHPWIIPTSSEMEMEFFTKFVPKKLTKDDKIEKLEIDLNGVVAIKRDIIIDEHNLDVGGEGASSPIFERVFSGVGDGGGGEFTPNVDRCTDGVDFERGGDFGDISGDFGVGTSSPIDENVPCLQETPSTKETIDLLNVRVESLEKTIVTMNAKIESLEKAIVTMKSKRAIRPSSKISHPYTPDYVKRTKRQISKALSSARKKKKGKVNETIIEKELVSENSKDEGADIADEEADSNSKRS
ncbi:hypothetical protein MTR67_050981 [Solanum verrucosum]|uniref:Ulp1 protease family, C-terminal catalytic domain containing protein n=2 Tax=Solanum TaxID=4107 RepID=A0AAF0V6H4_SOLVR|nr:hypothetical protein MTR67_050981 [Solanum verrucosum]